MLHQSTVFLDRDGTIIEECNYLADPQYVKLLDGVGEALYRMQKMHLKLVIITNQSGISRGFFNLETLEQIHQRVRELLAQYKVSIDGFFLSTFTRR